MRQSEADKAEYEAVRKQYDLDTQARARGEDVPERPAANYSQDLVSPRLLCAVLPDGPEEDLEEVRKDADEVYKAPTKASRAEAEHEAGLANVHQGDGDDEDGAADTTRDDDVGVSPVIAEHVEPEQVASTEETPFMDISAFVPGEYAGQDGDDYSHHHHLASEDVAAVDQHQAVISTGPEPHSLDFHAVFETSTTPGDDTVVKPENVVLPHVESVSAEGISADGNMAYSYSSTTMVYDGLHQQQHPQQIEQPTEARIEELPDEPQQQQDDDDDDDDDDEDDDDDNHAGHGDEQEETPAGDSDDA